MAIPAPTPSQFITPGRNQTASVPRKPSMPAMCIPHPNAFAMLDIPEIDDVPTPITTTTTTEGYNNTGEYNEARRVVRVIDETSISSSTKQRKKKKKKKSRGRRSKQRRRKLDIIVKGYETKDAEDVTDETLNMLVGTYDGDQYFVPIPRHVDECGDLARVMIALAVYISSVIRAQCHLHIVTTNAASTYPHMIDDIYQLTRHMRVRVGLVLNSTVSHKTTMSWTSVIEKATVLFRKLQKPAARTIRESLRDKLSHVDMLNAFGIVNAFKKALDDRLDRLFSDQPDLDYSAIHTAVSDAMSPFVFCACRGQHAETHPATTDWYNMRKTLVTSKLTGEPFPMSASTSTQSDGSVLKRYHMPLKGLGLMASHAVCVAIMDDDNVPAEPSVSCVHTAAQCARFIGELSHNIDETVLDWATEHSRRSIYMLVK